MPTIVRGNWYLEKNDSWEESRLPMPVLRRVRRSLEIPASDKWSRPAVCLLGTYMQQPSRPADQMVPTMCSDSTGSDRKGSVQQQSPWKRHKHSALVFHFPQSLSPLMIVMKGADEYRRQQITRSFPRTGFAVILRCRRYQSRDYAM